MEDIKRYPNAPPQTYGVLKALMILAGYEEGNYSSWKGLRKCFSAEVFEKLSSMDYSKVSEETYTRARACTKHASRDDLIAETPLSGLGLAAKLLLEETKLAIKSAVVEKIYDLATCPHEDAINFEEFCAGLPGDRDDTGALVTLKVGGTQFKELRATCDKLAAAVAEVERVAAEQAKAEAEAAAEAAAAVAEAEAKAAEEAAAAEGEAAPAAEEEAPAE